MDEPAEFVVALLEGDIHPAPEEFSANPRDLEAENICSDCVGVESRRAFSHRHEMEEAVDIAFADEEFVERDSWIESSLLELIDGDL